VIFLYAWIASVDW